MEDAEAEAALLALGGTLAWKELRYKPGYCAKPPGGHIYHIEELLAFGRHTLFLVSWHEDIPHWIDSEKRRFYFGLASAKIACERHHSSGKWR